MPNITREKTAVKVLHLICSPKGHASRSAAISRHLVQKIIAARQGSEVAVRCLNALTMPHVDREFSLASRAGGTAKADNGSLLLSEELVAEVVESDAIVLSTPLHNLSFPSALKAWIDHVVRPDVTFRYRGREMVGLVADKPVFVVMSSGGNRWGDNDQDFLKPYLKAMFAAMGILSVEFFGLPSHFVSDGAGIVTATDAMTLLADSRPVIEHSAVHELWSQFW
ncbi:NAD(P)H-dependent oxidoreductase [Rhizobium sp. CECT 9324]|uniref:FMN-dependent NADH-azoreductase n=1 Tax=Rhizobium sp. CECT 9324 TaxID=2845820 RepID=UPI001E4EB84A|nr:NAD(P)H-dependent oxidoreductase [Rhizobium sp. CECT 9324]CAH0340860.1 FMN-dependent NADH-azoreductase [Rhizobium sp. CECT 9324]